MCGWVPGILVKGRRVCQERRGCKAPRRGLGYPHDEHICRGAPGMPGIQEVSVGLLGSSLVLWHAWVVSFLTEWLHFLVGLLKWDIQYMEKTWHLCLHDTIAYSSWPLSSVSPLPLSRRWCSMEKRRPASHNPLIITGRGKCFRNQFPADYTHVPN